jgi:6-phosphogluconolactonase
MRTGLGVLGVLALLMGMGCGSPASRVAAGEAADAGRAAVYIGTYTGKTSKGIYRFELDLATGKATAPVLVGETRNPSFLAFHPTRDLLYAVGEIGDFGGKKTGAVSAFAIGADGKLTLLNQQPSEGQGPCHLVVDAAGKHALVANYGSGTAAVLPIGADGKLRPASSTVRHAGSGPNERRQKAPHAHSINLDAANRFAFVADLGIDKVMIYRYDAAKGTLAPNDPPAGVCAPGAGPRHFSFHPNGKFAYAINELLCTVTAFAYDAGKGSLTEVQTVPTLPKDFEGRNSTAEVQLTPDGRFLYGSNRGHDSLAIFAVDGTTGKLTPAGHAPCGGKTPRNFGIDPTGRWLLCAHQNSDSIAIFRIDPETGALKPTGQTLTVGRPVCVKMRRIGASSAAAGGGDAVVFEDRFEGKLGDGWSWLRENKPTWRVREGGLEICVEPGAGGSVKNALLRKAPDRMQGTYAIEVTITNHTVPTQKFEQAGIMWYRGGRPVFKIVKELVDGKLMIIPGRAPMESRTVQLRLTVNAEGYVAAFRPDGKGEYKTAAKGKLPPPQDDQVSIQCYHGPADAEHWIRFDDFRIVRLGE